ncbi:MAG: endonuclease domain-containing protein [Beijerinckiaceae bacterium]
MLETRRSRSLRKNATAAEAKLWSKLRNRQLNGFKFVRQVAIGPYIADFCCREHKLIVEVDGATHSTDAELALDIHRTAFLAAEGYTILRVQNAEIFDNLDGILETILTRLEGRDHL